MQISRLLACPGRSREGHPTDVDSLCPEWNGLRPSTDMGKSYSSITGNRRSVVCRDPQIDAVDRVSLEREGCREGYHRPAEPLPTPGRGNQDTGEPTGEVWPDHTDLDVAKSVARWTKRSEDRPDVRLRSGINVSLELVFI
jgi:hypothetical protein